MVNPNKKRSSVKRQLPLTAQMPALNYGALRKICSMGPKAIASKYGLTYYPTEDGGYYYKDNGAEVLAVAHLDSVLPFTHFDVARLRPDTLIFAPNLDDRLGAYLILDLLLQVKDIKYDILLTLNEENGASTAAHFVPPVEKQYSWMFMFDRVGTGCTVYNYRGTDWELALDDAGFSVHKGSYSCITELGFLECKGVNFGAGYHDNHSPYAMASRMEILQQVRHFMLFWEANFNIWYPYEKPDYKGYYSKYDTKAKDGLGKKEEKVYTYPLDAQTVEELRDKDFKKIEQKKQDRELSTHEKVLAWKAKKKVKEVNEAEQLAQRLVKSKWERIQNSLLIEIGVMNIPFATLTKLYDANILIVGEVARMSETQILNLKNMSKYDAQTIRKALNDWDLDFNTNLDVYQVSISSVDDGGKAIKQPYKHKQEKTKVQLVPASVKYTDPDKQYKDKLEAERSVTGNEVKILAPKAKIKPMSVTMALPIKGKIKGPLSITTNGNLVPCKVGSTWCWLSKPAGKLQKEEKGPVVGFSHLRAMSAEELK